MAKYVRRFLVFTFFQGIFIFYVSIVQFKKAVPPPTTFIPAAASKPTSNFTPPHPLQGFCPVPNLDPLEPQLMHYFEGSIQTFCLSSQPDLVYKSSPSELSTDPELMIEHGVEYCTYQQIERVDGQNDHSLKYFPPINFTQTAYVSSQVAKVKCFKDSKSLYENVFYFLKKVKTVKRSNDTLNVFIFFLDSLSRLSTYRLMPQTLEFMDNKLKSHVFRYHIKTGSDSTPNLSAIMTGKRSFEYRERGKTYPAELPHCSTDECKDDFVDDWPFVWKDFAKVGYVTALAEEHSWGSIWNFGMMGFKNAPVDHYMRTFRLAWEGSYKRQKAISMTECIQNIPYYQKIFEWSEEVVQLNRDQPLFGLFTTGYGHDDYLLFKELDRPFSEMLTKLFNEGLFNDSMVIIMGDHGFSFGNYRNTWMGKMESTMPLFSVSLPPWFKEKYPKVDAALAYNTRRLTSWYDVHAMLEDVVHQRFEGGTHQKLQRGMSLFKKIQHNRTCENTGVPPMYCPCYQPKQLANTSALAVEAGKKVVEHLNNLLKDYQESCAELKFSHIDKAYALLDAKEDLIANSPVSPSSDLRVVVVAEPSKGLYEATLVYDRTISSHYIDSEVIRLDFYKHQSGCIKHSIFQAYCYCKNFKILHFKPFQSSKEKLQAISPKYFATQSNVSDAE